jgi:hypothetical protein
MLVDGIDTKMLGPILIGVAHVPQETPHECPECL